MNHFFIFPSENGYVFEPKDCPMGTVIMPFLELRGTALTETSTLSPFVCGGWADEGLFHKQPRKVVFCVGLVSRGINNPVHRGSYSVWAATCYIERTMWIKKSEAQDILFHLLEEFESAVEANSRFPHFTDSLNKFVLSETGPSALKSAIDKIPNVITNTNVPSVSNIFKVVGFLAILASLLGIFAYCSR